MAADEPAVEPKPQAAGDAPETLEAGPEKSVAHRNSAAEDDGKLVSPAVHTDIAYDLYIESLTMDPERRQELATKVKRKLDRIVLPAMCWVYFLQFLDKQTLNVSNAYSLQPDLHLVGRDYSWVAAITNIGYLVCAYPVTMSLQKLPIGRFVSVMVMVWGALLMLTASVSNFGGIAALRFLLGGAESCIGPAWMLLTTIFWTREEAPLRMSCWLGMNGLSALASAGIAWGLGSIAHPTLAPWRLIFLVIGIISFVSGAFLVLIIPSSPNDARFLSHEEKVVAVWRVSVNRTGIKHTKFLWYQAREAATDPKVWCIGLQALCLGTLNGSITNFMSAFLKSFGYDSNRATEYQMPTGAIQFVCNIGAGIFTSRVPNTLVFTIILALIPGIAGMIGLATIDINHQLGLTACSWLQGIFGVSIILTWDLVATNIAGHTKRTMVNGLEFCCYAAGNIIGPFLFLPSEAPRYLTAIKAIAGLYGGCIFFSALLGLIMWNENRKRKDLDVSTHAIDEQGFSDFTDMENKGFKYKL